MVNRPRIDCVPRQVCGVYPLVSVVMPVYKGEPFPDEAIWSIRRQSFNDFEFLIVDDGSVDASTDRDKLRAEIIKHYRSYFEFTIRLGQHCAVSGLAEKS